MPSSAAMSRLVRRASFCSIRRSAVSSSSMTGSFAELPNDVRNRSRAAAHEARFPTVLTNKMVVVIAAEAPVGVALNTAALLGVGLGHHHDQVVGPETEDAAGNPHTGMCAYPIPVLRASAEQLHDLRTQAAVRDDVTVHDMHQIAQRARTYDQMSTTLSGTKPDDVEYLGLALFGPRQTVDSLTGALALYR
ncbi:DUF2000 domain-containing protein [Kribbella capetownensis]|uniref:DUF2000 domain-containing protein n=1 Tax=Kribbella capetownensis TaxID=1572659 RepID=A0A4R0JV24_9ACTN|nr:DUF2000 domain-containing protein [Kribbella capetownensis]